MNPYNEPSFRDPAAQEAEGQNPAAPQDGEGLKLSWRAKFERSEAGQRQIARSNAAMRETGKKHGANYDKSPLCISEFLSGYFSGISAFLDDEPTSSYSKKQVPDSWSRGFVKGIQDVKASQLRTCSWEWHEPYNEVAHALNERYPDEFPIEEEEEE